MKAKINKYLSFDKHLDYDTLVMGTDDGTGIKAYTLGKLIEGFAQSELEKVDCQHVIVDARNEVIQSGYMCIKCNTLFESGDHLTKN